MPFDITTAEKGRREPLPVSPAGMDVWRRLTIAGQTEWAYPFEKVEYDHELDVFGEQPLTHALRHAGLVWVAFVRLPSGDMFGNHALPVTLDSMHWGGVITPRRYVSFDPKHKSYARAFGIAVMTRVPDVVLLNRVVNADRRHKP